MYNALHLNCCVKEHQSVFILANRGLGVEIMRRALEKELLACVVAEVPDEWSGIWNHTWK